MNCNHPECDCKETPVERNGKSYCSEACATGIARASAATGGGCGCGHAGCGQHESSGGASRSAGKDARGSLSTHGAEGSSSFRASAPGESAGLRGDGLVGDSGQRAAERPGRSQPDDARKMGFSGEDAAGSAMKPGAARPRGAEAPEDERSSVRRGNPGRAGIAAPGRGHEI